MAEAPVAETLGALLAEARRRLSDAGIAEPEADARLLVEHFTGTDRTDAIARPESFVGAEGVDALREALERRQRGEPVHRITGRREFYGLALSLSPDTLEPRPDTEALVDLVLPFARRIQAHNGRCEILDLGTGTGAVALAILDLLPGAKALGVDILPGAVDTARANADLNGLDSRFEGRESDWYSSVEGRFDIIVSNPPYVSAKEWDALPREVRDHDPKHALDGGPDGLIAYRRIAGGSAAHLARNGLVAVEIGHRQAEPVEAIFAAAGFSRAALGSDLAGRDRAMIFLPAAPFAAHEKKLGKDGEYG